MIVFDLQCSNGHVFEAWLASSLAYEEQRASGLLVCPLCGNSEIGKAVMAPAVAAKSNQRDIAPRGRDATPPAQTGGVPMGSALSPQARAEMERLIAKVAEAQSEALKDSTWVGDNFANQARAMHYGEQEHAQIHGTTSPQEARAMMEEGVPVAPLPLPVIPPDKRN